MATRKTADREVLRLVNIGRAALGMEAIKEMPSGQASICGAYDDPRERCPLSVALDADVSGLDTRTSYCDCPAAMVMFLSKSDARRLAAAWGTLADDSRCGPAGKTWWVLMPVAMARFYENSHEYGHLALVNILRSKRRAA